MLRIIQSLGLGILGFAAPRILMGLGMPIDVWAIAIGEYLGAGQDWAAEWSLTIAAIILALVFTGIEAWQRPAARLWAKVFGGSAPPPASTFQFPGGEEDWVEVNEASRVLRDEFANQGLAQAGAFLDEFPKHISTVDPLASMAMGWLKDGINSGTLKARGVLVNGRQDREIPPPLKDTVLSQSLGEVGEGDVIGSDGCVYSSLKFDRTSIIEYVKSLKD